jgi:hypothetical protein
MIEEPRYSVRQAYAFGEPAEPRAWWLYDNGARQARFDNPSDAEYVATLLNLTTTEQRRRALGVVAA